MPDYGFRARLIKRLEKRLENCIEVLKQENRKDLIRVFSILEKEIEIQKAYNEHEQKVAV